MVSGAAIEVMVEWIQLQNNVALIEYMFKFCQVSNHKDLRSSNCYNFMNSKIFDSSNQFNSFNVFVTDLHRKEETRDLEMGVILQTRLRQLFKWREIWYYS